MPIENIIQSQKQGKLFGYKLKEELNSNNKLYKLRELINWALLEEWLSKNVPTKLTLCKILNSIKMGNGVV
ncbi:MAG: hypothetical protein AB8U81_03730, partial [Rickettsia conorii subsp. raoultii]